MGGGKHYCYYFIKLKKKKSVLCPHLEYCILIAVSERYIGKTEYLREGRWEWWGYGENLLMWKEVGKTRTI